ncbi:MAG: hypothetical protein QW184_00315 [Nanopusillaceae archaeon]
MNLLENFIKYSYYANFVDKDNTFSTLIIAPFESGKTFTLMKFKYDKAIVLSDITYYGLQQLLNDLNSGRYRVLVIPELIKIISRKSQFVNNFISLLNVLIEEGVKNVLTYNFRYEFEKPIKAGLLAAINQNMFMRVYDYLQAIGFISRVIIFSYELSDNTINNIYNILKEGIKVKPLKLKSRFVNVEMSKKYDDLLIDLSKKVAKITFDKNYSFRIYRNLKLLLKGIALANKKKAVDENDLAELEKLVPYINLSFNKI